MRSVLHLNYIRERSFVVMASHLYWSNIPKMFNDRDNMQVFQKAIFIVLIMLIKAYMQNGYFGKLGLEIFILSWNYQFSRGTARNKILKFYVTKQTFFWSHAHG